MQKNSKWWTRLSNIFCKHLCECFCLQESPCGVAHPWMYAKVHAMNLCKTILSSLLLFIKGSVNRSGNKSNSVCLRWRVSCQTAHNNQGSRSASQGSVHLWLHWVGLSGHGLGQCRRADQRVGQVEDFWQTLVSNMLAQKTPGYLLCLIFLFPSAQVVRFDYLFFFLCKSSAFHVLIKSCLMI